jgi:hypothetical protein
MIESFFNTMQRELLDQQPRWATKADLASAIFEWIEAWLQPAPTAHQPRNDRPRRVRSTSHHHRTGSMIT